MYVSVMLSFTSKNCAAWCICLHGVLCIILFVRFDAVDLGYWLILDLVNVRQSELLPVLLSNQIAISVVTGEGCTHRALFESRHEVPTFRQLGFPHIVGDTRRLR